MDHSKEKEEHWNGIYADKGESGVSWFQDVPEVSLSLLRPLFQSITEENRQVSMIDVGGGSSTLIDNLVGSEVGKGAAFSVLDLSSVSLDLARKRLGEERASSVAWIVADILTFQCGEKYNIWHDRAVFHFFTDPADREKYVHTLTNSLEPNSFVIFATFAVDETIDTIPERLHRPPRCSMSLCSLIQQNKILSQLTIHFLSIVIDNRQATAFRRSINKH